MRFNRSVTILRMKLSAEERLSRKRRESSAQEMVRKRRDRVKTASKNRSVKDQGGM
jgi:hypothetical protein